MALVGDQVARLESYPLYHSSLGDDAIDLAEYAGLSLYPWQQGVLRHSLGEKPDGQWAAPDVGLIVPRQNGKGAIIEARELAGLFLLKEQLIIHTAHLFPTAKEGFSRVARLIRETPELAEKVNIKAGNGDVGIYTNDGKQALRFLARSGGGGRGFSADCLIMDEAYNVSLEMVDALAPTMGAMPNPQIWWTSSAGFAFSDQLRAIRNRGMSGDDPYLAYFEWSVDEENFDPSDPREWARANPSLGYRMKEDFFRRRWEESKEENVAGFSREHLGVWDMSSTNAAILDSDWQGCLDRDSEIDGDRITVAIDVNMERRASVVVAGHSLDGRVQAEVVRNDEGTDWILDTVRALMAEWDVLGVSLDSSGPAGGLLADFTEANIDVRALGNRGACQASINMLEKIIDRTFVHIGQPILSQAAGVGMKKHVGDLWRFDRVNEGADMTPLVAASLAVNNLSFVVGAELKAESEKTYKWFW